VKPRYTRRGPPGRSYIAYCLYAHKQGCIYLELGMMIDLDLDTIVPNCDF